MSNDRLRAALVACGVSPAEVAERVRVDPKTVERWISAGRTPYRTHRWGVAKILGVDAGYLWPEAQDDKLAEKASTAELVTVYPNRGAVPSSLWSDLVADAREEITVLVYAGLFWFDAYPQTVDTLLAKADAGVRVRLLLGDPDSDAIAARGVEEDIDMAGRIRITLSLIAPLLAHGGVEVRLHATTLYASLYRADDVLLANTHVYGAPAAHSPVLHLQRVPGGRLFDHYARSYERVWDQARSVH
ncbi:MAG: XRE family transcriptional regulator [Actinobacteria bacterium]|nr:XRE family transcriptional regulator [Actinomycetota bacterium]